jgi:hypothetical protein
MRKAILLLSLAGLLSLACLAPVMTNAPGAPVMFAPANGDMVILATPTAGGAVASETPAPGGFCARVTASQALTLRDSPGIDGAPVAWLLAGELVHLVGAPAGDWWPVDIGDRVAFARSSYLQVAECVK